MLKRLKEQNENKEDWREQVKYLLQSITSALNSISDAVSNEEDLDSVLIDNKEDIINGLKKQVAGALDIVLSGIEQLLDLFDYSQGDDEIGDDTLGDENGEYAPADEPDEEDTDTEEYDDTEEDEQEESRNRFLIRNKKRITG